MDAKKQLLYDENFEYQTSEEVTVYPNFESMGLKEELIRGKASGWLDSILLGIYAYGFDKPSAVQQRAIVPVIKGRDVIV